MLILRFIIYREVKECSRPVITYLILLPSSFLPIKKKKFCLVATVPFNRGLCYVVDQLRL